MRISDIIKALYLILNIVPHVVEHRGIEPLTSWLPAMRSPG